MLSSTKRVNFIGLRSRTFLFEKCCSTLRNHSTATAPKSTSVLSNFTENLNTPTKQDSLNYYIETYGCQMNLSDSEIVKSILAKAGHKNCDNLDDADIILTNTCAIRENAEAKIWHRLKFFESVRKKRRVKGKKNSFQFPVVGVLGCMAERLKDRLLLEEGVDFVCGPDAYRDIPNLLSNVINVGQKQANTVLSFEETYADINPVRAVNASSAFVSIMRGCNNMCSFCIVPFTRGRERSRPFESILSEVQQLSQQGVKEIVLLGQNVNGYHDTSDASAQLFPPSSYKATPGFSNMYRSKKRELPGARFPDLLLALADVDPEMRIRFTSPHPKDFPEEVISAIASRHNLCSSLHLPAQSGSTTNLARMRRGYSREAYLDLVKRARDMIPNVTISTDIIAGFCDETEEEHEDTLSLMREVEYDQAFMYAYSLRDRTHAAHTMEDNVPEAVKQRRLREIIDLYHDKIKGKNGREEHGALRLVLVEGHSTKSSEERPMLTGRTDGNKRVVFPASSVLKSEDIIPLLTGEKSTFMEKSGFKGESTELTCVSDSVMKVISTPMDLLPEFAKESLLVRGLQGGEEGVLAGESLIGQYVVVRVLKGDCLTLRGVPLGQVGLQQYHQIFSS